MYNAKLAAAIKRDNYILVIHEPETGLAGPWKIKISKGYPTKAKKAKFIICESAADLALTVTACCKEINLHAPWFSHEAGRTGFNKEEKELINQFRKKREKAENEAKRNNREYASTHN